MAGSATCARLLIGFIISVRRYEFDGAVDAGISRSRPPISVVDLYTVAATLICSGMILIEKRLRSAVGCTEVLERVTTKRQCFFRFVSGGMFSTSAIMCWCCRFFITKELLTVRTLSSLKKYTAVRSVLSIFLSHRVGLLYHPLLPSDVRYYLAVLEEISSQ